MGELSNTTINGVSYDFKDAGAARQSHSHTKSQITDFPTSMPASDVSAWAKASTKPTYNQDEVGDGTTYKRVTSTEKTTWNNKGTYSKPSGGIPKTDLASAVQTSLGKADSALQSETDPTVPSWAKASSKPSYTASEVGAVPNTSAGVSAAINLLTTGDSAPTDNDYYVSQYAGGGTSTTTYHRRPVSKLWDYIKSKLSSKGSATQPVYFSNGVPVATTYSLGKSVPSDAKFTDTTYSNATTSAAGLMSAADKSKLDGIDTGSGWISTAIISSRNYAVGNGPFYQGKHVFGPVEMRTLAGGTTIGTIETGYMPSYNYLTGVAVIENSGQFSVTTYWLSGSTIKLSASPPSNSTVMLIMDYLTA